MGERIVTETCNVDFPTVLPQYGRSQALAFSGVIPSVDPDCQRITESLRRYRSNDVTDSTTLAEKAFRYLPIDIRSGMHSDKTCESWLAQQQIVPISTMAPEEQFEVIRIFQVTVQSYEDEFRADFVDANLSAFGTTKNEAVWNLKDIIAATFDTLLRHEDGRLARGLARQLAVLKSFIRKRI
jgi:hypothetical protein